MIPATRIDPTAAIIQNMIPLPNTPGLFNYTAPGYSNFRHTTIPSIKIDHSLSAKMKLAAYYSATKTFSPQTNGFPQPYTALQPQDALSQTIRINLDTTLTPTLLLHIGAGYLHTVQSPDRPHVRPEAACFPRAFPSRRATSFPIWRACIARIGGGWSGGGRYPASRNTGVAFGLTPMQTIISRPSTPT